MRNEKSVEKLFEKLEAFTECCGLELNRSKTEALWLGKTRPQSTNLFNINWPKRCVCLGVSFSCDSEASTKDNFEKKFVALEKCLNVWSSRDLTLFGKITIIKSLALSKIIFISSVLSIPTGFADQVNKSLSNFIWNHKPPKIKRSTMIGRIKDGRPSMPDFDIINKSLKAGWVKRLLDPQVQSWKTIPFSLLDSVGGPLLFKCNFSLRTLPELPLLPLFYRDVPSAWESISKHTARTKNEFENEILWNNHEVTIGGKSVFYKQWYDAGVKTLPDILDKEGKFLAFTVFKEKYKINTCVTQYRSIGGKSLDVITKTM